MTWTAATPIDRTNSKYGVVATIPFEKTTVLIWQDTTNPPINPLDMDELRTEIADLEAGFYSFPEHHIFADVVA